MMFFDLCISSGSQQKCWGKLFWRSRSVEVGSSDDVDIVDESAQVW